MTLLRDMNKKGCQQVLAGLAHDREVIERGIGQASAREEAARLEAQAMSRCLSVIDVQSEEVRARLAEIEAAEEQS
jgi:hypothetical protein